MNIFKYRLKVLLKDKTNLFWALIFPLGLAIFFYLGFGTIEFFDAASTTTLTIISEEEYRIDPTMETILSSISYNEDTKMFKLEYIDSLDEAKKLYSESKIDNYFYKDNSNYIIESKSDNDKTIIKSVVGQYQNFEYYLSTKTFNSEEELEVLVNNFFQETNIQSIKMESTVENTSFATIYFYALVAMICLYASLIGLRIVLDVRADNSFIGIRAGVTPTSRSKILFIYFLVGLLFEGVGSSILVLFIRYVLRIEFGNMFLVLLATWLGDIVGLTFGMMCASLTKMSRGKKEGIINSIVLLSCFLSGLMMYQIKHMLDNALGIFAKFNPATPIADSFFSLYFYDNLKNYFIDLGFMGLLSVVFFLVVCLKMRGEKYESI